MAYLDLNDPHDRGASASRACQRHEDAPGFSALEWGVIASADRDHPRSLDPPGRLSAAIRRLFGQGGPPRLADGRLEALRRFSVLAWRRGYAIPAEEVARFTDAGFAEAQIRAVLVCVTGIRPLGEGGIVPDDGSRECRLGVQSRRPSRSNADYKNS